MEIAALGGAAFSADEWSVDGLGNSQVDASGVIDAELVEEVEPGPNGGLEVCVGSGVRVAELAVPPGDVDERPLAPTPPARSLFTRLGHRGLPCLADDLGAH